MIRSFSIFFISLPFLFGLLRAAATGNDFRYLWVAAAALLGASAFTIIPSAASHRRRIARSVAAFIAAAVCAIAAAMLLGTRFGPGLLVVATSFAFSAAAGCMLFAITQH